MKKNKNRKMLQKPFPFVLVPYKNIKIFWLKCSIKIHYDFIFTLKQIHGIYKLEGQGIILCTHINFKQNQNTACKCRKIYSFGWWMNECEFYALLHAHWFPIPTRYIRTRTCTYIGKHEHKYLVCGTWICENTRTHICINKKNINAGYALTNKLFSH